MANIDLRKKVRVSDIFIETVNKFNLKQIDYENMFFVLAKLSKSHKDETVYRLNLKDFFQLTGDTPNLTRFIDSMTKLRSITFVINDDKRILIDGFLSSVEYLKGTSTVEVKVSSKMKPYLLNVVSDYSEHQLYSIMRLKSKHAKRLYLFFNGQRPTNGILRAVLEMQTIEEFKIKTGYKNPETGEEIHPKWSNFKNRVLDVAKKEINALSNIKIAYKTKKFGHETYWIEWYIENKNNTELIQLEQFNTNQITSSDKDFKENLQEISDFAKLTKVYGLDERQAKIALKRISKELLNEVLAIIDDQVKKKKDNGEIIRSMGAYSVKVFFDKGLDFNKK